MDASLYKTVTVSRGLTYNYYAYAAQQGKWTLLFCHGFPSTANDWRRIVPYFKERGYGLIVPDMLGYGGTDKPTDPASYLPSKLSRDLVDILDAENVDKAVAIGHDWGCKAVSRVASYYPERFSAYAFFALCWWPANFLNGLTIEEFVAKALKEQGSERVGYWLFFAEDDADDVIRAHIDSFANVLFPHDPETWKTRMNPTGGLRSSCLEDFKAPLGSWLSAEEYEDWKKIFLKNGFAGPTCWYKVITTGLEGKEGDQIPPERVLPPKTAPIFFGGATQDHICLSSVGHMVMGGEFFKEHNVTIRDFDGDHWIVFSKADEICKELEAWLDSSVAQL